MFKRYIMTISPISRFFVRVIRFMTPLETPPRIFSIFWKFWKFERFDIRSVSIQFWKYWADCS